MSRLLLVCVLLTFVASVYSLTCYNCTEPCDLDKNKVTCGIGKLQTGADGQAACSKFIYKDKSGTKTTSRKCILKDPKQDYTCTQSNNEVVSCNTCTEDLCNSTPGINTNAFNVLASTACLLLVVKFFL